MIEIGTIVILVSIIDLSPFAACQTTLVECEGEVSVGVNNSVGSNFAVDALGGSGVEVIPIVVNHLPACHELAGNGIIGVALIVGVKTECGNKLFTAVTAYEHAVNKLIFVSRRRSYSAPVNDRVTIRIGADGSAGVAFLCAGSFLVGNRCLGVVMPLADGVLQVSDSGVKLCDNVLTDIGEACNIVCGYDNRAIGILYFA